MAQPGHGRRLAMPFSRILIIILSLIFSSACALKEYVPPQTKADESYETLIQKAQDVAVQSQHQSDNSEAEELATTGKILSETCIIRYPEKAGCYYWHAVNTGLYHRVHIIGYQRGVKMMINDCNKVIELDEKYDNAGAYRILGGLYTQLPQTGGSPDSVVRDLTLAEKYLRKAVKLSPDYPENHLSLAETLFEEEKFVESQYALATASDLVKNWQQDSSFNDWQNTITQLKKKLSKKTK